MPLPVARITLENNRTYRGVFATADDLRGNGTPVDGDYAQVYTLQRYYRFDGASTTPDNGSSVLQPIGLPTGRWVSTTATVSGFAYSDIVLDGSLSDVGDGTSIVSYEWVIVDEPSGGTTPASLINPSGSLANLRLPVTTDWSPGGTLVFLRVTNDIGQVSTTNAFSPLTPEFSSFHIISATPNSGFLIPAAGVRNWHVEYRQTFELLDDTLSGVGGSSGVTLTRANKRQSPTAPTSGLKSEVSGVVIEYTPANDSYVRVSVNGLAVEVGDGDDAAPCYFADPGDLLTAKTIKTILQNDKLVWNGPTGFPGPGDPPTAYELDTDDVIEIEYLVASPEPF